MTADVEIPLASDEESTLAAALTVQRESVIALLDGLSDDEITREVVPSGWSLLGLVQHLGWVETYWARKVFLGEAVELPWEDGDDDADWDLADDATRESVVAFYRDAATKTDEIIEECDFGSQAALPRKRRSLRWIVVHLIQETAHHAGHGDIARELVETG